MLVFLLIALLVSFSLLLLVFLLLLFLAIDVFLDLPYVATKKATVETIIKLAQIKKAVGPEKNRRRETVVDLGSGDGRLLFAVAAHGAKAIGYEVNPFLVFLSLIQAKLKGFSRNVIVYKKSLWKADLKVADVIIVYAYRKTMQKFEEFIYQNARKGTRIVVNTNPFPSKKFIKSENDIFLYEV